MQNLKPDQARQARLLHLLYHFVATVTVLGGLNEVLTVLLQAAAGRFLVHRLADAVVGIVAALVGRRLKLEHILLPEGVDQCKPAPRHAGSIKLGEA